jgi:hypothetical protein
MKIAFTDYVHSSKEDMAYTLEEVYKKAGLEAPEGELDMYAFEISLQCELDTETDRVEIIGCDGYLIDKTKKLEVK